MTNLKKPTLNYYINNCRHIFVAFFTLVRVDRLEVTPEDSVLQDMVVSSEGITNIANQFSDGLTST